MRPVIFTAAVLLSGAAIPAFASREARLRAECGNEIGLLCGGRQDVAACLDEQYSALTPLCRDAVREKDARSAPAPTATPTAVRPASTQVVRATSSPAPHQAAAIDIQSSYSGKGAKIFESMRALVERELPGVLHGVAERLGMPQYSSGLSIPLHVTFGYDPTYGGIGRVQTVFDGTTTFNRLDMNLARWEECPNVEQFRSQLRHEMTHVVLADYFNGVDQDHYTFTGWLDEGLATMVGGEPLLTAWIDADYVHYASKGGDEGNCPLDNDPRHQSTVYDCYPRYYFAVREIGDSSPDAIAKFLADLRQGISVEDAVRARTGANWSGLLERTRARAQRTYAGMWFLHKARHKARMWFSCTGTTS